MPFSHKSQNSIWYNLISLLVILCISIVIGQLIIKAVFTFIEYIPQQQTKNSLTYKNYLLISQTIMSVAIFIVAPIMYWLFFEKKSIKFFFLGENRYAYFITLTLGIILMAMIVNTLFTYWNMQLKFPSFLEEFEKWAQAKEIELKKLTDLLTTFDSFLDLCITVCIIGIIPAIGEEFLFRGILQNLLYQSTRNIHTAVLISAFIFSAIHLQVYGLVPRFLLGALFGYLYSWTNNLIFPIIAHFFNNGLALFLLFIYQRTNSNYELNSEKLVPIPTIILCGLIGIFLTIHLRKKSQSIY